MWQEQVLKDLILKIVKADREGFKILSALSDLDIHVENKALFSLYNILMDMIDADYFTEVLDAYEKGEINLEEMRNLFYKHIENKHINVCNEDE